MNKLNNIQALRGIAVLVVVFSHLLVIEKKFGGANTILPGWLQFGIFGVDLFFVISGFVMVTVTRGKFQSLRNALLFLYHRVSRIYPLYWVYTTLALIVFLIQPTWVNSSQGNQVNILASYLLLPDELLPLVQVGWTLIHEIYFYLVFFVILLLVPEKLMPVSMLVWGLVIFVFGTSTGSPAYNLVFHPLTIEFIIGCLLAWHYHKFTNLKINGNWLVVIAGMGMIAAIIGFVSFVAQTGFAPDGWWRLAIYGIPAAVIVASITHAERNRITLPNFLIQSGNASYSIYLSHLFTINVVGRVWKFFSTDAIYDNFIALPIVFPLALLVGFMSYKFLEIPLLTLIRKIA